MLQRTVAGRGGQALVGERRDGLLARALQDAEAKARMARAALDLAKSAAPAGELAALESRIAANPQDHEARLELASALFAAGRHDEAADQLLASIAADREWNEGAARAQLLKFIEAQGLASPWAAGIRRKLSSILFT